MKLRDIKMIHKSSKSTFLKMINIEHVLSTNFQLQHWQFIIKNGNNLSNAMDSEPSNVDSKPQARHSQLFVSIW